MVGEKERVEVYQATVERLEPDITMVDRDAALASIAISLKRIADALENENRWHNLFNVLEGAIHRGLTYGK